MRCASRWRPARSRSRAPTRHVTFPGAGPAGRGDEPVSSCGYLGDAARACSRAPRCAADYQAKCVGPFARPDRSACRGGGGERGRSGPAAARRGIGRSRGRACRRGARRSRPRAMPAYKAPAPMPKPMAHCSKRSRRPTNPGAPCWRRRRQRWACRRGAIRACCGSARTIADLAGAAEQDRAHPYRRGAELSAEATDQLRHASRRGCSIAAVSHFKACTRRRPSKRLDHLAVDITIYTSYC
jgi:hypothetical protein